MGAPTQIGLVRAFVAIPVPLLIRAALLAALKDYQHVLDRQRSPDQWHITLAFLGEVEREQFETWRALDDPLVQSFVPTFTLTHIGQGRVPDQLWAYLHPTPLLMQLQESLQTRFGVPAESIRPFVPHITLGNLRNENSTFGPPDHPLPLSFVVPQATLYESQHHHDGFHYLAHSHIPLTSG